MSSSKVDPLVKAIADEAFEAAAVATQKYLDENPGQWYPCGFAWVKIKPARGKLVSYLKEEKLGRTDEFEGGFSVWNPSGNHTQWMDAKRAGAVAFAEVLKKHGINAFAQTRID